METDAIRNKDIKWNSYGKSVNWAKLHKFVVMIMEISIMLQHKNYDSLDDY